MKAGRPKTYQPKPNDLQAAWYLIDAAGMPLGRLASEAAKLLVGKHKPAYAPHLNCGDWLIIINSDQVSLSGRKETEKTYYRHSGHPGNLRSSSFSEERQRDSSKAVRLAIRGMLPKNKLRQPRLNRLKIYAAAEHPHAAQKPAAWQPTAAKGGE